MRGETAGEGGTASTLGNSPGLRRDERPVGTGSAQHASCPRPVHQGPPETPEDESSLRLFCLPYAGGGAAVFRGWRGRLGPGLEAWPVELPGRGARLKEQPQTRLRALACDLAGALDLPPGQPYAFLGYSLGALLAFEAIRELRRRGQRLPARLFVAARRSPRLRDPGEPIHLLPDADFVREIQARYPGGIPEPVLREAEVMALLLPSLRADFEMLETYQYAEEEPLDCPVTAFRGHDDARVPLESLEAWSQETRGDFMIREFPGGHFFLRGVEAEVQGLICDQLGAVPGGEPSR